MKIYKSAVNKDTKKLKTIEENKEKILEKELSEKNKSITSNNYNSNNNNNTMKNSILLTNSQKLKLGRSSEINSGEINSPATPFKSNIKNFETTNNKSIFSNQRTKNNELKTNFNVTPVKSSFPKENESFDFKNEKKYKNSVIYLKNSEQNQKISILIKDEGVPLINAEIKSQVFFIFSLLSFIYD